VDAIELQTSGSSTWAHPIITNAKLILRDQDTIHAFDIRESR
jgi:hypothetical protein